MANLDQTQLGSYAPSEVVVVISQESTGFTHQVVGFAEDSFIQLARDAESWTHSTGADGYTTRTHNINSSGKVTLELMQSSPSNDVLSAIWNRDRVFKNNSGLFSITIKDGSGRSIARSDQAYISVFPDQTYGSSVNNNSWIISAANLERYIGGNSLVSGDTVDTLAALETTISDEWKF